MSSSMTKLIKRDDGRKNIDFFKIMKQLSHKKKFQIYFLAFIIPLIVMCIMAIANGIYPFGTKCFLRSDLYNQYVPFYAELQQKLKSGEGLNYSWNFGLGSDFMAIYAYYLASPLALLTIFVSTGHLIEFMTILIFLKIALCGLTMCYYLVHHFKQERYSVLCFSVFYALSGFMAAYNWDIMWLDSVALAPLIVLGIEALVKEHKWKLYCVTLGLSIMINYYISIMICIFLILYFLVLIVYIPWKEKLKAVALFAFFSILSACLSAVVMLPGVMAIMSTGFANSTFPSTIQFYFNALDVIARHCINVSVEISTDHWPNIYSGVAVLFLFPLYVSCKQIPWKQKIPQIALLAVFVLAFSNNVLNFIWHGFNYPDSLPARQSFLYTFVLLTVCYEAFLHVREMSILHLVICYVVACAIVVCSMFFAANQEDFTNNAFILTIMFLTVYVVLGMSYKNKVVEYKLLVPLVLLFVTFEAGINTYNTSISTVTRSKYITKYNTYQDILSALADDSSFYRIDTNTRMTKNDAPLSGFKSATIFSSTVNYGIENFYEEMGMDYSKVYYCYEGATPLTSALLGVKYFLTDDDVDWADSFHIYDTDVDGLSIYQMKDALSIGYCVPSDLEDTWSYSAGTAIDSQNSLANALGISENLFDQVDAQTIENQTTVMTQTSGTYYVSITGASKTNGDTIDLTVTGSDGTEKRTMTYKNARKSFLLNLGYCDAGDTVTLETETGSMSKVIVNAYVMNDKAMEETLDVLGQNQLQVTDYGSDYLNGTVTVDQNMDLVLSIPYDTGWTIKVDGVVQNVDTFANAFPELHLTAGTHEISMTYIPAGKYKGLALSLIGLAVFCVLVYLEKKRVKKRSNETK